MTATRPPAPPLTGTETATVARLRRAADEIGNDGDADPLTKAVGSWLSAEAAVRHAIRPMVGLLTMSVKTTDGCEASLSAGMSVPDGVLRFTADTSQHALAVADAVIARYALVRADHGITS